MSTRENIRLIARAPLEILIKKIGLNFSLYKECPKLLCGLGIGHRRSLFQCGIVQEEK